MPAKSKAQFRAMQAAAHGHSTLGIPASVGKEFASATENPKGLPAKVGMGGKKWHHSPDMYTAGTAQPGSENPDFPESAKSKKIKKWGPTHVTQSK